MTAAYDEWDRKAQWASKWESQSVSTNRDKTFKSASNKVTSLFFLKLSNKFISAS
jgi:hypothetical protein